LGAPQPSRGEFPLPGGLSWWRSEPGGAAWLGELPRLVAGCADDWGLTVAAPFEPASISWVAPAELPDGTPAVLKVNFPEAESEHEADALAWWAGEGSVTLLAHDPERRALLIARCDPGATLWSLDDEPAANRIAAGVLRRLWKPAATDGPFRALEDEARRWAEELPSRWARHGRPFSRALLSQVVALCAELGGSQPDLVVCHQDLHGGNVLSAADRGWLAIDPKPLVGERAFDLASLLRDRRGELLRGPRPARVVRERLDLLTGELDVDRDRARGWGIVHALAWGLTDDAVAPDLIECARLLAEA
jgi:streptomycin 6-kinase